MEYTDLAPVRYYNFISDIYPLFTPLMVKSYNIENSTQMYFWFSTSSDFHSIDLSIVVTNNQIVTLFRTHSVLYNCSKTITKRVFLDLIYSGAVRHKNHTPDWLPRWSCNETEHYCDFEFIFQNISHIAVNTQFNIQAGKNIISCFCDWYLIARLQYNNTIGKENTRSFYRNSTFNSSILFILQS